MTLLSKLMFFGLACAAWGQPLTREATPGSKPPAAKVQDLAWLEGAWTGKGIRGAPATEVYSAPAGGRIAGHFEQLNPDGSVMFYEIMQIVEVEGSLQYRLKHFNADLIGWEEKAQVQSFSLVAVEEGTWYFNGLTIKKDGEKGMIGAVRVKSKDGTTHEVALQYQRK